MKKFFVSSLALLAAAAGLCEASPVESAEWRVGEPVVTYWAGPGCAGGAPMDDASANQLVEGGWNLAWCQEKDLDLLQRHGLRGLLWDPLINVATLDDPKQSEALDALLARVRVHPALYSYFLLDEPGAQKFAGLGRLVARLHERDPAHLAYINLHPIYARNEDLGVTGAQVEAYNEYLQGVIDTVKPQLLSYDHYQFMNGGDNPLYFLNLDLVRKKSAASALPFMNIVQASWWVLAEQASPRTPRVPTGDELRYLVYTTLAYGGQAISYYVYSFPQHTGGIALRDGTPTPLYDALKPLNRQFVTIAKELQPLRSLGVFHAGMHVPGTQVLAKDAPFVFDPPIADQPYESGDRVQGAALGEFAPAGESSPTHVLVVNLDYKTNRIIGVQGPGPLDIFDATTGKWSPVGDSRAELSLVGGEGKLLRVHH